MSPVARGYKWLDVMWRDVTWPYYNVNKPGPSTNMTLTTFKMYHIDPPKMGWPLKTRSRTGNNGKKSSLL